MIWTTKQKDGSYRTIDTNNASILDFIIEFNLMRREEQEKKKKKR